MGTREEENQTLQEQQQRATQARLEFIQMQKDMAERQRLQEEADRKAAEDALVNGTGSGGSNMVADPEQVAPNWPDDGFQAAPQTGLDRLAGVARVGKAGDVAFARDLLNSGQAPLGSASTPSQIADGAKEQTGTAGARGAKPALGLG
jgi:hypothetical protein